MASKTNKRINYKKVFKLIESSLIELIDKGPDKKQNAIYKTKLDSFKEVINPSDEKCFEKLVMTAFYSGFKADTVTKKRPTILGYFPSWKKVSTYTENDVERIMSDPEMIKNERRIKACVTNAKRFKEIVDEHGSFHEYIKPFKNNSSKDDLERLRKELKKFKYLGKITVNHFMKDIGFPVLKPDRVIMRIFERLGLVQNYKEHNLAIDHGTGFANATGDSIRYIDFVFVTFGQVATSDLGIERGICLEVNPRCKKCQAQPYCNYFHEHGMPS